MRLCGAHEIEGTEAEARTEYCGTRHGRLLGGQTDVVFWKGIMISRSALRIGMESVNRSLEKSEVNLCIDFDGCPCNYLFT